MTSSVRASFSGKQLQTMTESISVPLLDDFHVHLRQGALMELVTPTLSSGCRLAYGTLSLNQ
jgi:hypothetical protein